jgi:calcineurin-like phosphoesterase family protein
MVLEETPYEADVHRNPESIRTDMESTSGSAEGAGEGSMVQEGANTAQDAKGTEIDTEDGGKILDQIINNHDDNCTRMGEDEYSHEEKGILHTYSIVQNVTRSSRQAERHHYPDKGQEAKRELKRHSDYDLLPSRLLY